VKEPQPEPFGPPEPAAPDLSTATITQLVAELKDRHDALLVVGEIDRTDEDTSYCRYSRGHLSRIIGMLWRAHRFFMAESARCEREAQDDEEADG
jgi:hypothetical protein